MAGRRARLAAAVSVALAATACSDGAPDDGPDDGPDPTVALGTPAALGAGIEPAPSGPVDPCTLLEPDQVLSVAPKAKIGLVRRGFLDDTRTQGCLVSDGSDYVVSYGFSTVPDYDVSAAVQGVARTGTKRQRLTAGERSSLVRAEESWVAWASEDRYAVQLELVAKPDPSAVSGLLDEMLARATDEMFAHPVNLPPECPQATSRPIVDVLGEVTHAIGYALTTDRRCHFANERGFELSLGGNRLQSLEVYGSILDNSGGTFSETEQIAPGVILLLAPSDAFPFAYVAVREPLYVVDAYLQAYTNVGELDRPLRHDPAAFRAVTVWFAERELSELRGD
ncbi:MAG: hypothetical protein WKF79_10680 [Nocardioides sp.]